MNKECIHYYTGWLQNKYMNLDLEFREGWNFIVWNSLSRITAIQFRPLRPSEATVSAGPRLLSAWLRMAGARKMCYKTAWQSICGRRFWKQMSASCSGGTDTSNWIGLFQFQTCSQSTLLKATLRNIYFRFRLVRRPDSIRQTPLWECNTRTANQETPAFTEPVGSMLYSQLPTKISVLNQTTEAHTVTQ
jgi:hypothetical protein